MITSLLQVVNRLDASWLSRLFIHKLDAICFNTCNKSANIKSNLDRLDAISWSQQASNNFMTNLHQAGKISNLHQEVCWISADIIDDRASHMIVRYEVIFAADNCRILGRPLELPSGSRSIGTPRWVLATLNACSRFPRELFLNNGL